MADEDYDRALAITQRLLDSKVLVFDALMIRGQAASRQGNLQEALRCYELAPNRGDKQAALASFAAGEILLQLHRASDAERKFAETLAINPRHEQARDRMAYLLGVEGRRWEAMPHLFEMLRRGRFPAEALFLIGDRAATVEQLKELNEFRRGAPHDPLPLLGLARIALRNDQIVEAERLVHEVLSSAPEQLEAQVILGQAYIRASKDAELRKWLRQLPEAANYHPDIWTIRGQWARREGQPEAAARCFWEALRLDPNQVTACFQLAQLLRDLQQPEAADRLSARAVLLQRLSNTLGLLYDDRRDLRHIRDAVQITESLGRLWEAWGWCRVALSASPVAGWAREAGAKLELQLGDRTPQTLESSQPARQLDLCSYPLPVWGDASPSTTAGNDSDAPGPIRFKDVAEQAGIDFTYFSGSNPRAAGRRIQQTMGGGAAVLDYDGDSWPDIFLTQGCHWPPRAGQQEYLDRLYRNTADGRFTDTATASGIVDGNFGQGVTVGDYNNDGFPDLYIANIGSNYLYSNQGDGTFKDVTKEAGIESTAFTTSVLLADLSGDGVPDIYDVNYVEGQDIYQRLCRDDRGRPRTCNPADFRAQPDRFYLGLGDGRFQEATLPSGFAAEGGNGLGIVAADFQGSGRLGLFVSNDQDANFYFLRLGEDCKFVERGVLSGLAFDADGRAQACMGIAAGDANNDGKIDLFVTNFYKESNTLYLQDSSESFVDATAAYGLRADSYYQLGFGTQFIDGDLDGWRDLAIANGHIDDLSDEGVPSEMSPQYFRNLGNGRFKEVPGAEIGEFFTGKYFGRSMARLDWNRDGREDLIISHLGSPAALLSNQTASAGHYLAVQLRGVQSSRDAIGSIVTITAGAQTHRQWLTAGDGYQASNQRQLIFGLGPETRIEKLAVHWPSGLHQEFHELSANQELLIVENSPRLLTMPAPKR